MKLIVKYVGATVVALAALATYADDVTDIFTQQQTANNTRDLVKYLKNLGSYLGYDLTTDPNNQQKISYTLVNLSVTQLIQNYLFNTVLGAIPVNTASQNSTQFVPNTSQAYAPINSLANYTFSSTSFSSPAQQGESSVSVSSLIDQQTYQKDPVSQAILNILATPDYSYCMNYDGTSWLTNCQYPLNQNKVMMNVLGSLPSTYNYFTYNYNQQLIPQLNTNSLIAPLLYSTTNTGTTSGSTSNNNQEQGLVAQNQEQQAANFIRYATGSVAPLTLPNLKEYDTLYMKAINSDKSISQIEQMQAQTTLANYLANLRIYAAQTSVGISNLYYMLSKRMPQNQSNDNSKLTSQALSEFAMATWRLYNPDQSTNTQWLAQINQASSATVQKEIVTLLAEINYQLYLSRQQQERLLLTNTMLLLQNARASQPSASFNNSSTDGNGS